MKVHGKGPIRWGTWREHRLEGTLRIRLLRIGKSTFTYTYTTDGMPIERVEAALEKATDAILT